MGSKRLKRYGKSRTKRRKTRRRVKRSRQKGGSVAHQPTYITRENFNRQFNTDVVILPKNMMAIGIENGRAYVYHQVYNEISVEEDPNAYRINGFIQYILNDIHPKLGKSKYYLLFNFYDGHGERTPATEGTMKYYQASEEEFKDKEGIALKDGAFPLFHKHKYVFAYAKRPNDIYTVLVPDAHYLKYNGYKDGNLKLIDENRVAWEDKQPRALWRGSVENGTSHDRVKGRAEATQNLRKEFMSRCEAKEFPEVDCGTNKLTIPEQLVYKYILDINGFTTTWDASVWKLYSGSLVLKVKGTWKQWYSDDLKEGVHYISVENDFSDLNSKIEWSKGHDAECKKVAEAARQFVLEKLNWERVRDDTVEAMKDKVF